MTFKQFSVFLCIAFVFLINVNGDDTLGGRQYTRQSSCRKHLPTDDDIVRKHSKDAIPPNSMNKPKGYLGTVAILGGVSSNSGAAYFAAVAALRVGADEVRVFCYRAHAASISVHLPDVNVHPLLDVNVAAMIESMVKHDVVVIGPGLEWDGHVLASVNQLIARCIALKKPLILDLHKLFLTATLAASLVNYPLPGVIMTLNNEEFETYYPFIKAKDAFSDSHINIDFAKAGRNAFIYRKGCTDMGMSESPKTSWSLSKEGSRRRSAGQGCVIAGAAAVYFHWALQTISKNATAEYGHMLPAASAVHSAASLMRACNHKAYQSLGRSALTSDMVKLIGVHLYGQ